MKAEYIWGATGAISGIVLVLIFNKWFGSILLLIKSLYYWILQFLKSFLLKLGRVIFSCYQKIKIGQDATNSKLGKLTPIRDANEVGLYLNEIKIRIDDPDVKNIALTGPYGSGKSTIIQTFFSNNPQYYPLFVSLAAFKDDRKEDESASSQAAKELESAKALNDRIEYSILQQLFYHVKGKDVPFSRLKRIRTVTNQSVFVFSLLVTFYLICLAFLYKPDWLPLNKALRDTFKDNHLLNIAASIGFVLGTLFLVYLILRFQRSASLIKLNLDKASLEISPDKGSSVLNQHMDEIVYYFTATKHDVLVIEDLDRFKNSEIFVKLREINVLINNSLQISRKVTFLYALSDDVFIDENRTKFFDFILPVVPVINASNSGADLMKKFELLELDNPVSTNLLQDLGQYIVDRRLIQTIVNEFYVYKNQLNNAALKNDMLLGLIVYKNLYPTDFAHLQANKGMVYDLFQERKRLIKELLVEKDDAIGLLKEKIESRKNEFLSNVRELRVLYIGTLFALINKSVPDYFRNILSIDHEEYTMDDLLQDEVFYLLLKDKILSVSGQYGSRSSNVKFSNAEAYISHPKKYSERFEDLKNFNEISIDQIEEDIRRIRIEMRRLNFITLKELIIQKGWEPFITPIKKLDSLAYLVQNGLISDEYKYYLSYFKPGELNELDHNFVLTVKKREILEWTYKLTYVEVVTQRLSDEDCRVPSVLNFDLLAYLLGKPDDLQMREMLNGIIHQLSLLKDNELDFIEEFRVSYPSVFGTLIALIAKANLRFSTIILTQSTFSEDVKFAYIMSMIYFSNEDVVIKQDGISILVNYLSENADLLSDPHTEAMPKLMHFVKALHVQFEVTPPGVEVNKEFVRYLYENNLYALNSEMVNFMIYQNEQVSDIVEFNRSQLTNILTVPLSTIKSYIENNFETYIVNCFLKIDQHDKEDEDAIVFILNRDDLSIEIKKKVIEEVEFMISDLSKVPNSIYADILHFRRVKVSWFNVIIYYRSLNNTEFDEILIDYLSQEFVYSYLAEELLPDSATNEDDANYRDILPRIFMNQSIPDAVKDKFVHGNHTDYDIWDFQHISHKLALGMLGHLAQTEETIIDLKDTYPDLFVLLVFNNWENLSSKLREYSLEIGHYKQLLNYSGITPEQSDYIYSLLDKSQVSQLIIQGQIVPSRVLENEKLNFSTSELTTLVAQMRFFYTPLVMSLLSANVESLNEPVVLLMLERLGEPYAKLGRREGKEITLNSYIPSLLEVLKKSEILIEDYKIKNKIAEIKYLSN